MQGNRTSKPRTTVEAEKSVILADGPSVPRGRKATSHERKPDQAQGLSGSEGVAGERGIFSGCQERFTITFPGLL